MKRIQLLLSGLLMLAVVAVQAQVKTPQPSPASKTTQTVGLSEITVEYSRPSVKGRTIYGDLVPYDQMWRAGANKNTIITVGDDVTVEGKELKKGSYAFFVKPGKDMWTAYFYTDTENWGTPEEWDASKVAAEIALQPKKTDSKVESLMYYFDHLTNNDAHLVLAWADQMVSIKVAVPTGALTQATIDKTLAGPSMNDYRNAARYYREEGKDLAKAKEWIEMSLAKGGDEKFWIVREHALILAEMKDYKGAVKAAEKSLALAEAAEYQAYIDSNKKSIAEWSKKM